MPPLFDAALPPALTAPQFEQFDADRGEGGAFLNRGDVVVDGEANFTDNRGSVSETIPILGRWCGAWVASGFR